MYIKGDRQMDVRPYWRENIADALNSIDAMIDSWPQEDRATARRVLSAVALAFGLVMRQEAEDR